MSDKVQKAITARYISDEPSDFFVKGEVYSGLFWPVDDSRKLVLCYIDHEGEEYGMFSDHFEIIEDNTQTE